MRKRRTTPSLIGQKFGKLTVVNELHPLPETFTSAKKRHRWWICTCDCGKRDVIASTGNLKSTNPKNMGTKSCGCLRRETTSRMAKANSGIHSPNYKGCFDNGYGYTKIYVGKGNAILYSERANTNSKYVLEHVYVMSKFIGRLLTKTEQVHHIKKKKNDNRIENLELWSTNQPTGARVQDKTEWAIRWLREYSPASLAI